MKKHTIPYNIMEVDFKLFGFMNVKQFTYVAGGCILGYLMYVISRSGVLPMFLGIPLAFLIALTGIGFGLVNVRGRYLDQWLLNYIAAINSPLQRVWLKKGVTPDEVPGNIPIELMKPNVLKAKTESMLDDLIKAYELTKEIDEGNKDT